MNPVSSTYRSVLHLNTSYHFQWLPLSRTSHQCFSPEFLQWYLADSVFLQWFCHSPTQPFPFKWLRITFRVETQHVPKAHLSELALASISYHSFSQSARPATLVILFLEHTNHIFLPQGFFLKCSHPRYSPGLLFYFIQVKESLSDHSYYPILIFHSPSLLHAMLHVYFLQCVFIFFMKIVFCH